MEPEVPQITPEPMAAEELQMPETDPVAAAPEVAAVPEAVPMPESAPAANPTLSVIPTPRKTWPATLAAILIAALVFGGGVYAYEKKQQTTATQDLQLQINSLKAELAAGTPAPTATPLATAKPTATATATPSPTASASAAPIACAASNLVLSLSDTGGGAAGTYYYNIVLTNNTRAACTISGYPAVSMLDADGASLGSAVNSEVVGVKQLTVDAGKAVYAAVGFPNPANFDSGKCSAAAAKMAVTAPNTTTALTILLTRPYCPGFSVSALSATKL
jgi:hypothetical protein